MPTGSPASHDLHVGLRAFLRSEAAGDLLLHLTETDTPFCFVICERNPPVGGKSENIPFIVLEPFQQTVHFPLFGESRLPLVFLEAHFHRISAGSMRHCGPGNSANFFREAGFTLLLQNLLPV